MQDDRAGGPEPKGMVERTAPWILGGAFVLIFVVPQLAVWLAG